MQVRRGIAEDAEAIVGHQLAMALETEKRRLNEEELRKGVAAVFEDTLRGFYIVAVIDGMVAGNLMITTEWSDWTNRWVWWIQSVYVKPEFRKSGIYRSLYDEARRLARQENVKMIRLYVDEHNEAAMKVYERLGMGSSHYRLYEEVIE